ncbi:hypothetical protein BAUCODRAFT_199998 [Baudoinia panamericana UAMH 10762]|uniref:Uncharacterized protein n=1 Tax=Baudoinia panamericana (strain UAMH 10762) TaxID=717646 RepID=M2M249_BAUPA|nr:uncharacterized protein BAUCODRAFT_199998 [Baudoinia panamericana UAMH 10762]EMD01163.1 hypothetical protein BAUCODRAFT_199998 [Baudoinia panamericana UAMH 10762]
MTQLACPNRSPQVAAMADRKSDDTCQSVLDHCRFSATCKKLHRMHNLDLHVSPPPRTAPSFHCITTGTLSPASLQRLYNHRSFGMHNTHLSASSVSHTTPSHRQHHPS